MPTIDEKTETEEEDMEHETPDSEKSSDDESGSVSGSDDDDNSSELDEVECEKRKNECLDDMAELERQFSHLREQLYSERMTQIELKLVEVQKESATEYLSPLQELDEELKIRQHVAGVLKDLRIQCIRNKFESEESSTHQNMESEKILLIDSVKQELEEKIRKLEEDRHNIDISSDLWDESQKTQKKNKKKSDPLNPDRRRKPVTVSGPYIVYMLKDLEIIEDWTAIKKAIKQQTQRKKTDFVH